MTTPIFTSPFTGTVVQPTDVSYYSLSFGSNVELYWPAVVNPTQIPLARIMDCSATAASLQIALPEANQGSTGSDCLIRNKGAYDITVTDFTGASPVVVPAGVSQYFYLSDNTTSAGVWGSVTFGAGTSAADAAALAGAGLTATALGKLATTGNIAIVSVSPSITDASRATTFVWTSGAGTFTLPTYTSLSSGWYISFRNNGTGALTIAPSALSTLNGQSNIIVNPGDSGTILYDSSTHNFYTVGWNAPNNVAFSAASYDVDSISGSSLSLVSYAPIIQTYLALSSTRTTNLTITLPNITQLYVLINDISASYNLIFQVSGSSASPLVLGANSVATIVVDGGQIYSITQSSTSSFFAQNGSQSNPSFSFTNDTHTGMYLVGTSILGLTANSIRMLNIDNTNTSAPVISSPAEIRTSDKVTAIGGIFGGTF